MNQAVSSLYLKANKNKGDTPAVDGSRPRFMIDRNGSKPGTPSGQRTPNRSDGSGRTIASVINFHD